MDETVGSTGAIMCLILGCWDLELDFPDSSHFFPRSMHCPGNCPEKDKVLLINRAVNTQHSPKQGSPVKSCIFKYGLGREAATRLLIDFCLKVERQLLCLSRIGKNGSERGLA